MVGNQMKTYYVGVNAQEYTGIWILFKLCVLNYYRFSSATESKVDIIHWDTVINGQFLTLLYENAGIRLNKPMAATRYINVFY
ncbi:hypothetical protein THRCLA_22346 [Thraustotheca clavata]|uniref:Uncharacterized protein n=1 Tax=Thraustotheca clavata TaxID=74557 RepID=A0A1V9Z5C6_9STRA|nr:hypothetical protein THRCLA_22346 [Thraustotheca clavata]